MSSSIAKKLTNVSTLYYLFVLEKHFPDDRKKIKQKQNKNVHKLMKRAYEIPFYRKRFDACHLTRTIFTAARTCRNSQCSPRQSCARG